MDSIERFATLGPFRRLDFMYLERNERKIKRQSDFGAVEEDGTIPRKEEESHRLFHIHIRIRMRRHGCEIQG